jgi:dimethylhistidine N-methyltransferase
LTAETQTTPCDSRITATKRPTIIPLIEARNSRDHIAAFARAVRSGLLAAPRTLPWPYFYDEEGSRLFEAICDLPEYYLTRTEDAILRRHSDAIIESLQLGGEDDEEPTIIELGSGSAVKTQRLIAAALRQHERLHYVPIDVSPSALEDSAKRLTLRFPTLRVTGFVADYRRGLERIMGRAKGARLIVFLGSSIGNYEPDEAADLLAMIARTMRPTDRLLLGTDMAKDPAVLEAAYDDARSVTAAFNLNILRRINRELGGDFQVEAFRHRAVYRPDRGRIEMHLVSETAQSVKIAAAGLTIRFAADEAIHTESSHKYTSSSLSQLQARSGFREESAWSDGLGWFRLERWRPVDA